MKFAPIAPISLCPVVARTSDYLMALPAMMSDPDYHLLYRQLIAGGSYVMLDNGLSEDKNPLDAEHLERLLEILGPNEMVLPDYLRDGTRTVRASKATLEYLLLGDYEGRFMAVAQGNNLREYMDSIYQLLGIRGISCIGLSKYFPEITGLPRRALLNSIAGDRLHSRDIEWHLLGVCESVDEVQQIARDFPWLRGIDTCYPVLAAMKGINLEVCSNAEPVTSPEGFFEAGTHAYWPAELPQDAMYDLLYHNLKTFDAACHGRSA